MTLSRYTVPILIGAAGLIPAIWVLAVFGWTFGLLFTALPALGALAGAIVYIEGMKEHDPNWRQYETVLDMIRGYPFDWKIGKQKQKPSHWSFRGREIVVGPRYSLHDTLIVTDEDIYSVNSGDKIDKKVYVVTADPTGVEQPKLYEPKREYAELIREAIRDMHITRELKTFVNIAIKAEEETTPLDRAREKIENFKKLKDMGDPKTLALAESVKKENVLQK